MAKKSVQQGSAHQRFVITTGYILFAFMVLGLVTNTIVPSVSLFFIPHIRFVNMLVFLVSLVVSALLPAIMAYAMGDASTRTKSKQLHHYNGVVFAILAYWVYVVFGQISPDLTSFVGNIFPVPIDTAVRFMIPVAVTLIAVGALAFYYHRGGNKRLGITEYRPFQLSILALMAVYFIVIPVQQMANGLWSAYEGAVFAVEIGFLLASYLCLVRLRMSVLQRVMLSVIGLTFALIAQYLVSQLMPGAYTITGGLQPIPMVTMFLVSFMVAALYLYTTRHS